MLIEGNVVSSEDKRGEMIKNFCKHVQNAKEIINNNIDVLEHLKTYDKDNFEEKLWDSISKRRLFPLQVQWTLKNASHDKTKYKSSWIQRKDRLITFLKQDLEKIDEFCKQESSPNNVDLLFDSLYTILERTNKNIEETESWLLFYADKRLYAQIDDAFLIRSYGIMLGSPYSLYKVVVYYNAVNDFKKWSGRYRKAKVEWDKLTDGIVDRSIHNNLYEPTRYMNLIRRTHLGNEANLSTFNNQRTDPLPEAIPLVPVSAKKLTRRWVGSIARNSMVRQNQTKNRVPNRIPQTIIQERRARNQSRRNQTIRNQTRNNSAIQGLAI